MKVTININKIVVLQGYGTDKVRLCTDLPCAIVSNSIGDPTDLGLETTKGAGVSYAEQNFPGIPIEVINMRG
jgi:hypothetical protein